MSSLKEKLKEDLKVALKEQNKEVLAVVRMLISAIQYGETAAKPIPEFDSVLTYRKQLLDSLEMFPKGSEKQVLIEKELQIVERYMPKAPSEEELLQIIKDKINSVPKDEKINMGLIMKDLKQSFPTCDGKMVMGLIQKEIALRK
ncbi:GatB/YqeY domain-containing protein [Fluviispira vulneris]|uniref:GatB/YqeY domain-containing protein n=1 Tax=Fluviispira vulneris TaxID=2763012 RepID=UPI0016477504|nr:GatB/YqeY domain-containing protein [Fluviispira vulneris]